MGLSTVIGNVAAGKKRVQFIQQATGTVINIDCTVSETHERESPPTEFEIEDGSTISDHIILKPIRLEITGMISDTPISIINAIATTLVSAVTPPIGIVGAAAGIALSKVLSDSASPSVAAFNQLLQLQESKTAVSVLTTLKLYDNMFISKVTIPRDANTGKVLMFTVSLVQLLLVSPQTVNITIFKNSDLSAGQSNVGSQGLGLINGFTPGLNLERSITQGLVR